LANISKQELQLSNQANNRDVISIQEKGVSIFIDGVEHDFNEKKISYEQVVKFAEVPVCGPTNMVTVAYERGENGKSATLAAGQEVKVKEGMFFHVEFTNRS